MSLLVYISLLAYRITTAPSKDLSTQAWHKQFAKSGPRVQESSPLRRDLRDCSSSRRHARSERVVCGSGSSTRNSAYLLSSEARRKLLQILGEDSFELASMLFAFANDFAWLVQDAMCRQKAGRSNRDTVDCTEDRIVARILLSRIVL